MALQQEYVCINLTLSSSLLVKSLHLTLERHGWVSACTRVFPAIIIETNIICPSPGLFSWIQIISTLLINSLEGSKRPDRLFLGVRPLSVWSLPKSLSSTAKHFYGSHQCAWNWAGLVFFNTIFFYVVWKTLSGCLDGSPLTNISL